MSLDQGAVEHYRGEIPQILRSREDRLGRFLGGMSTSVDSVEDGYGKNYG